MSPGDYPRRATEEETTYPASVDQADGDVQALAKEEEGLLDTADDEQETPQSKSPNVLGFSRSKSLDMLHHEAAGHSSLRRASQVRHSPESYNSEPVPRFAGSRDNDDVFASAVMESTTIMEEIAKLKQLRNGDLKPKKTTSGQLPAPIIAGDAKTMRPIKVGHQKNLASK